MDYLYIVPTNKDVLVTVRISESVRDQFKKAAELRGSTMSGLLHQFIVRTIREEKEAAPQEFKAGADANRKLAPVVARISPTSSLADKAELTHDDIQRLIDEGDIAEIERRLGKTKGVRTGKVKVDTPDKLRETG